MHDSGPRSQRSRYLWMSYPIVKDSVTLPHAIHQASNQAMQRTAGRSALPLSMTSILNPQRRALLPAVADPVSR